MLTNRPRRLAAAVALTCSLTAPLTACTSSGDSSGSATSAAPSTTPATPVTLTGAQLAERTGKAALAENSVHLRATVMDAAAVDTVEASMAYVLPSFQGDFVLTGHDGRRAHLIFTDKGTIISGTGIGAHGKKWVDADKAGGDAPVALVDTVTLFLRVDDPAGLRRLGPAVVYTPAESSSVPGTTQYTARLTPEQFAAVFGKEQARARRAWMADRRAIGTQVIVNVDEEGRPARLLLTLVPNSAEYTMEVRFSGWGQPVKITPPPPSEIAH